MWYESTQIVQVTRSHFFMGLYSRILGIGVLRDFKVQNPRPIVAKCAAGLLRDHRAKLWSLPFMLPSAWKYKQYGVHNFNDFDVLQPRRAKYNKDLPGDKICCALPVPIFEPVSVSHTHHHHQRPLTWQYWHHQDLWWRYTYGCLCHRC